LAAVYLVWVRAGRRWVPIALCVAAALVLPANAGFGMFHGAKIFSEYSSIKAQAGESAEKIAHSKPFTEGYQSGQMERAARAIPLLRRDRIGIFAR
jgi:hypothetical protein